MRRVAMLVVAFAVAAVACGDSGEPILSTPTSAPAATSTTTTAPPETSTTTTVPPTSVVDDGGAVATLEGVRDAVVQIVAKGTFQDPSGVQANVPGAGSGFIIDPSGIAVTNNHVVTGAGLLEVFLDGEDRARNARVLGVSECSDLAVIDIDGEGFPYLEWFEGDVVTGLSIFAAGFPLGDPEYTLLDGIVSKEDAGGETTWASVDAVIEHSADTLPGNSGGPIVTADGKIVAVNYAGNQLGQSFAIGRDVARGVVEQLRTGVDVNSIGINGEAIVESGASGIWVYSVDSGSPADVTGVAAGDIVFSLEDLLLAGDGTMSEYCDVLRSHDPTDVLDISVYRPSLDAVLEGQLNSRELELVTSFATELDEEVGGVEDDGTTYTDYVLITDDSDLIEVSVPVEWFDTSGDSWNFDGELIGPALSASSDLDGWRGGWETPGMFIGASALLPFTMAELLDSQDFSAACDFVDRFDYDDGLYTGFFDLWENCGGVSAFIVVAAQPADEAFLILVQITAINDADLDAADQVIATFQVTGDLAG